MHASIKPLAALALAVFILPWLPVPDFWITQLNYIGMYALVALGLVLLTGIGGLTSFGQAAFAGIGAYSSAYLCTHFGLSPWVGLVAGLVLTGAASLVLGWLTLRMSGHYLPLATLGWALFAALSFAATDILVQAGAPKLGFTLFMPVMFGTVALLSFPLILPHIPRGHRAKATPGAWAWGTAGIILLAVQATGMNGGIGLFGNATGANIVYTSRGLWSLLLLALLARRLGVGESTLSRGTFALRLLGSVLILAAVVLVMF